MSDFYEDEDYADEDYTKYSSPKDKEKIKEKIAGGWKLCGTYLLGWIVVLVIAKKVYTYYTAKRRSARRNRWFGPHPERDAYEQGLSDETLDEDRLRKLLLRRAMTDFRRMVQIAGEKDSLYDLMRCGAVAEDMWADFKEAENEMQLEIFDLQAEAETFKQGWSDNILKDAAELVKREDQLSKIKKDREKIERQKQIDEKKLLKAKEHEERQLKDQEERASKLRERFLAAN